LHVLQKHHPRAVAVSAATGQGLDTLREAVMEMLSEEITQIRSAFKSTDSHRRVRA